MQRFIDITACLFHPPGWNPGADEISLRPNERIDYSAGDIDEYGGVGDKVGQYKSKLAKTMSRDCSDYPFDLRADSEPGITVEYPSPARAMMTPQISRDHPNPKTLFRNNTNTREMPSTKTGPAISIPYITINKIRPEDSEFTLIYFHANSEDLMTSIRLCRVLCDFTRVSLPCSN